MTPPNSAPDERMGDRDVERKMRVMAADCFFHVSDEDRAVIRQATDLLAQHRALKAENERLKAENLTLRNVGVGLTAQLERLKKAAIKFCDDRAEWLLRCRDGLDSDRRAQRMALERASHEVKRVGEHISALAQATTEKGEG